MTGQVSPSARVAAPGEGFTLDELRLAGRNQAMPLEALRYDITPIGLHYLLTHYDIPFLDPAEWRLTVGGRVRQPLSLDLAAIQRMPVSTAVVTFECAGNGRALLDPRPLSQPWLDCAVGTARWTGVVLASLLREAEPPDDAVEVVFTGADHGIERGVEQTYARSLPIAEALRPEMLLAYEMNGAPLPAQHGAPLRLVVPGWYGMAQVKWLTAITVHSEPFCGFQQVTAYRLKQEPDDPGEPVTRMRPRALMIPPGFPDFMTRARVVDLGPQLLRGRAWTGHPPVTRVEVSTDGCSWADAELGLPVDEHAWQPWQFMWEPREPGLRVLMVRATDVSGRGQPTEPAWNRQGMANNTAQRVEVLVREDAGPGESRTA